MSKIAIKRFLWGIALCWPGAAAGSPCEGPRTPYQYPIVLRGEKAMLGYSIDRISVVALREGKWHAIPFQIDEINSRGDFVLNEGLPYTKATDDGVFDENDELVFWGEDLGEVPESDAVPAIVVGRASSVLLANFCRRGSSLGAVAVLVGEPAHPKPSPRTPDVRFDRDAGTVTTDQYLYKFKSDHPALLGEVALRKDGVLYPIFSKSEFLMPLETTWFLPDLLFRSEDFASTIESWQSGPIRTVVAVGVKYTSFLGLVRLHLFSELVFYRNRFQIPTVIEFMFDPRSLLKPGSGLAYSLTFPEGRVWEIKSNLERLPAEDPDLLAEKRGLAAQTEVFYATGSRPEGSFLVQVVVDEEARQQVPPPFLMGRREFTGESWRSHWSWLSQIPGDLGLYLDISMVKKGTYDFGLDLVLSPKAKKSFTDYGFVDVYWSRVPIPDFRVP